MLVRTSVATANLRAAADRGKGRKIPIARSARGICFNLRAQGTDDRGTDNVTYVTASPLALRPSGPRKSNFRRCRRGIRRVNRAEQGEKEFMLMRFPSQLCSDGARAISISEMGWPNTLRGEAAELYLRWERDLKPQGFPMALGSWIFPAGCRETSVCFCSGDNRSGQRSGRGLGSFRGCRQRRFRRYRQRIRVPIKPAIGAVIGNLGAPDTGARHVIGRRRSRIAGIGGYETARNIVPFGRSGVRNLVGCSPTLRPEANPRGALQHRAARATRRESRDSSTHHVREDG